MTCAFDGCSRQARSRGLCATHAAQRRAGKLLTPIRGQLRAIMPHPLDATLALVPLTRGHVAVISVEDVATVRPYRWYASITKNGAVYAKRALPGRREEPLHHFIGRAMGLTLARDVDHENGNTLDCRRTNLRDANRSQNRYNTKTERRNTSGVKGVSWRKRQGRWEAYITANKRRTHLGFFDDKAEAAAVVQAARTKLHGVYANHGGPN